MTGVFVAIEGPNGVGKSTVLGHAVVVLEQRFGLRVHATKEPSATSLGAAIRELEGTLPAEALALACAADRLDHLAREIDPALTEDSYVISDRYVPSSLVLQRLDGLELEYVWGLNKNARAPDLVLYLDDEPETISQRLAEREQRSRFEATASSEREVLLYREAYAFLDQQGWRQSLLDCRGRSAAEIGEEIAVLVAAAGGSPRLSS